MAISEKNIANCFEKGTLGSMCKIPRKILPRRSQFSCDIFRTDLKKKTNPSCTVARNHRCVETAFYPLWKQNKREEEKENAGKQIQNTSRKTCGVLFKALPSKASRNCLFSQKKAESALKYVPRPKVLFIPASKSCNFA